MVRAAGNPGSQFMSKIGHSNPLCQRFIEEMPLRGYFLYRKNQKHLARATTTIALFGIKFFIESVLRRDWTTTTIPRPRAEH